MRVVVDSNALLVSISRKSDSNWLFKAITEGGVEICFSNEILVEYEEILSSNWNETVAQEVVRTLLKLNTAYLITPFFQFQLISADADDNKFTDCAIAANADYLVTNDHHFDVLKQVPFPKVNAVNLETFEKIWFNQIQL